MQNSELQPAAKKRGGCFGTFFKVVGVVVVLLIGLVALVAIFGGRDNSGTTRSRSAAPAASSSTLSM
jgi:hypothetical protein